MKQRLVCAVGVIVLAMAVFATGAAWAAEAAGPYYATPSWDQTLPSNTRFVVLTNMNSQAVLDRETGLVWERSPSEVPRILETATWYCNQLTVANRKGWRLPTMQELASLLDLSQSNPSLPSGHPFTNVQSDLLAAYWSATTYAGIDTLAWTVRFNGEPSDNNFVHARSKASSSSVYTWCVRGGQGVDPQ